VWREYVGGYSDWLRQSASADGMDSSRSRAGDAGAARGSGVAREGRAGGGSRPKLTYNETRELGALPSQIEALETEQRALAERMATPDYYQAGGAAMKADQQRSEEIESLLHAKLERWEALEEKTKVAADTDRNGAYRD
jgi:ATP-binding cassette subfamily F protein uup